MKNRVIGVALVGGISLVGANASANHHIIQIEQAIGGVDGDVTAQAVQLRMRTAGQQFMSNGRLRAFDAQGNNPILLQDMTTNVTNGAAGSRVLIASANFANYCNITPNYVMTSLIPESYFNGGRITFEDNTGIIWWSLAFGGANYTGSNAGDLTNDADGNFGPPFGGPLPSSNTQSLLFQGTTTALSTNNAADYALSATNPAFRNNAGTAVTLVSDPATSDFWDINGTTAGAGGATPSGNWNGLTQNFNTDAAGGTGGARTAVTSFADTVIFAAGNDATGSYTVTLTGTRKAGSILVEQGNVNLTGGILSCADFNVDAGGTASVSSPITGGLANTFTKGGTGTLTLSGGVTYTGETKVTGGTLISTTGFKNGGPLNIFTGAKAVVPEASPNTYTPPSVVPSGSNARGSKTSSLSIAGTGQLDLGNSDLAIDHNGSSPLDDVRDLLTIGYNGGGWDGVGGIISNTLNVNNPNALDPSIFAIGYAENIDLPTPYSTGANSFFGIDVDDTTVVVKFTWLGDLNLDGFVDFQDLSVFNTNYDNGAASGRYWFEGDFNYDGFIDFQDLSLFNTNYDPGKPSLPEPGAIGGVALLGVTLRRARRAGAK